MISSMIISSNYTEWQTRAERNLKLSAALQPPTRSEVVDARLWPETASLPVPKNSVISRFIGIMWDKAGALRFASHFYTSALGTTPHGPPSGLFYVRMCVHKLVWEVCGASNVKFSQYLANQKGNQYLWEQNAKIVKYLHPINLSFWALLVLWHPYRCESMD